MKTITVVILSACALFAACDPSPTPLTGLLARPDISPDGTQITFIHAANAASGTWEVYRANIETGLAKKLTDFPEARIKKGPVWSPDGKHIAFHGDINDGAQLFVMDPDGGNMVQLTDLPGYNVEPHWSPDGREIVFNSAPPEGKVVMMIMNRDGSNIRELPNPDGHNWYPRIKANGQVIFTSNMKSPDYYDIYLMERDSSGLRALTDIKGINWFPEYAPDGSEIAFHSNMDDPDLSDSGDYNLYIMKANGSGLRQLTDLPGQELHAKWHPSGNRLIFEWHHGNPKGLFWVHSDTGEVSELELYE